MAARSFFVAIVLGILTAFALFWAMQALISVSGDLQEAGKRLTVDFVRLRKDRTPELKKRELMDEVIKRSGVRKKFAKPVIEAMIDVLGEAILEGREVNLQPFGKIKQQRTKDAGNARITIARIRQSKNAGPALDPEDRADDDNSNETVAETVE